MIELRGIIIGKPKGKERVRFLTRDKRGGDYKHCTFSSGKPLTFGTIISFLCKQLKLKPKDIKWAEHVKIPEQS